MSLIKYLKDNKVFIGVSAILFVLMLIIEKNNNRFQTSDFTVFYMAAKALLTGNKVYGVAFGLDSGLYKYSPFMLFIFSSYTLLSFKIAAIINFFISAASAISSIIIIQQIISKYFNLKNKKHILTSFLILISVLLHIVKDLHLGNINVIITFFLILTIKYTLESKYILSALFMALVIFAKPYFIVLLPVFIIYKYYKIALYIAIFGISLTLSTFVILGFSNSLNLHIEWINAMLNHSTVLSSTYTIFYLLNYYFNIIIPNNIIFPLFIISSLLIPLYFFFLQKRNSLTENYKPFIISFFLIIAIIPNFLITDNEHFIFSLPIIATLILYLRNNINYLLISLLIIVIFMYGGNSTDLVGRELTLKIKYWGWLGIGNILLIIAMIYFSVKEFLSLKRKM